MFSTKEKRGQFYMIAAVVISALIISISIAGNSSFKTKNHDFYDLEDEIKIESKKTLDAVSKSNLQNNEFILIMENFTDSYVKRRLPEMSIYFIFGDSSNITLSGYQNLNRTIKIESGNEETITTISGRFSGSIDPQLERLNVTINQQLFSFEIMPGKNFYFILIQSKDNEEYIKFG